MTVPFLFITGVWLLAVIGWVMNLSAVFSQCYTPLTGFAVGRVIGVFIAPIGAVLGWL